MRRVSLSSLLTVSLLAFAGCAQVPTQDLDAAKKAMDGAKGAQASVYAPDSWNAATDAQSKLDAELALQQDRNALFRSYSKARALAADVKDAADRAANDAVTGKQKAKDEATAEMAKAKEEYDRAQKALAGAPKGKGTEADLASLRSDSGGIATTLQEMQSAFDSGDYPTARVKAQSVIDAAQKIENEIEKAKNLRHTTA